EALYEALEVSMDRDDQKELHKTLTTSHKRHRDVQDPPPLPPKDSDQSKKKKQDFDAFASQKSQGQQSSSSSKQKQASQSEQPINDVPILDDVLILYSEDIGVAPLPKIKTRPDWLKPVPKEDIPETPEPD
nr:hypothetical protein [Tanacetum cinerariifolium]